ncbi:C-type mannose receptor 2-like [Physella acuta]|uniref:C-type mannose receptor 2-like n=1 Tax=Physella acuta TaxID=109671 RepID=UPI0027DDE58D|nr:C-type mannose receptor 2-like [Physella acuta]
MAVKVMQLLQLILFAAMYGILCSLVSVESVCNPNWDQRVGTNTCYLFVYKVTSWYGARSDCFAKGGVLTSVSSQDEQDYIAAKIGRLGYEGLWIGFTDEAVEGRWINVDGTPVSYTNWYTGEPNDDARKEDCAAITQIHFPKWYDKDCSNQFPYICKSSTVPPWQNKLGTNLFYMFVRNPLPFYYARDYCRTNNGLLASIASQQEQNYFSAMIGRLDTECWWIGLTDEAVEGRWENVDGTPVSYTNWYPETGELYFMYPMTTLGKNGEPNNVGGNEDCAGITQIHFPLWYDKDCNNLFPFTCKYGRSKSFQDHCWIGFSNEREIGVWQWEDGSPVTYLIWDRFLTHSANWTIEHCAVLAKYNFSTWHDEKCVTRYPFICKQAPNMTNSTHTTLSFTWENKYGTDLHNMFVKTSLSWYDARDYCILHNGNLISVTSQEEQDYITGRIRSAQGHSWIGLSDELQVGNWQWKDGSPLTYFNWDRIVAQTDNTTYGYCALLAIYNVPMWHAASCMSSFQFICKRTFKDCFSRV